MHYIFTPILIYPLTFSVKKKYLKARITPHVSETGIPLTIAFSQYSQKLTNKQMGFWVENVVTNSHTIFIWKPLVPPLTILVLHVLLNQSKGGLGLLMPVSLITIDLKEWNEWQENSVSDSYKLSSVRAWDPCGRVMLPNLITELRVLQGILPKGPGGFCIQHNSSNWYYK